MWARKGFTLVELMVVILIVAILAAVAIPIMRGRIDAAKWSEGKAMMGTIGTAIRAYVAEKNITGSWDETTLPATTLGFQSGDLTGTYFADGDFQWTVSYDAPSNALTFTVTANCPAGISSPPSWTLNQAGLWTEGTAGP